MIVSGYVPSVFMVVIVYVLSVFMPVSVYAPKEYVLANIAH